jgi:hypothetical protein
MDGKPAGEPIWRTSKLCESGACIEVGVQSESVLIRSSANLDGRYVTLSRDEWQAFVAGVKDGDFDSL